MARFPKLDVFLDGAYIGELRQTDAGATTFMYDDDYRRHPDATPLSLSMPVSRATHPPRAVLPFSSRMPTRGARAMSPGGGACRARSRRSRSSEAVRGRGGSHSMRRRPRTS